MRVTLSVAEKGLYFIAATASPDESPVLSFYDHSNGSVTPVVKIPKKQRGLAAGLSISPDRRNALLAFYDLQGDLLLVDNFR